MSFLSVLKLFKHKKCPRIFKLYLDNTLVFLQEP